MPTTEYHWIITISWSTNSRTDTLTVSNTYSVIGQIRRADAFDEILKRAIKISGAVQPNVLFFSIEPNQLGR